MGTTKLAKFCHSLPETKLTRHCQKVRANWEFDQSLITNRSNLGSENLSQVHKTFTYVGVNVFSNWITYFFTHNLYIYQYFPNNLIYIWMLHLCKNCCIWIRYPWQRLYFQGRLSRFQVLHIDHICHSQSNLLYLVSWFHKFFDIEIEQIECKMHYFGVEHWKENS